jgi:hypothetical protein
MRNHFEQIKKIHNFIAVRT